MEFKSVRMSDYVTLLDENYDDIFNKNYMNQLFYKKLILMEKKIKIRLQLLNIYNDWKK